MNELAKDITLSNIKDFLLTRGGKSKYSELFDHFRNSIVDSSTGYLIFFINIYLIDYHKSTI
jgi:hypothetical protein